MGAGQQCFSVLIFLNSRRTQRFGKSDFFASQAGEDPLADYLLGHGYWQLQQYGQSADYFQSFLQDDKAQGMETYYNAQYYYTLSLMAAGKMEAARAYFDGLEGSHPFYGILEGVLEEVEG